MNLYFKLYLIRLMLIGCNLPNKENNPVLIRILEESGCSDYLTLDNGKLKDYFYNLLSSIEDEFSYFDSTELKVNTMLNIFLRELLKDLTNNIHYSPSNLRTGILSFGNKEGEWEHTSSVEDWLQTSQTAINELKDSLETDNLNDEAFGRTISKLQYAEMVLGLVDTFITASLAVEPDMSNEAPHPDFVMGVECQELTDCECQIDHAITTLQGMEDYLNGKETPERYYFNGVALSNDVRIIEGTEGAVFDKIKETGTKAYNSLLEGFNAIRKVITETFGTEAVDKAKELSDTNKKSLEAVQDKTMEINDAAGKGIVDLATKTDPDGEMKGIVSNLKTVSDAPGILDRLTAYLSEQLGTTGDLNKTVKEAEDNLSNLRKAASDSTKGDEENKDVVAANKQILTEKTNQAKEALKKLKAELKTHTAKVGGIRKAIAGITPKIFVKGE